MAEMSRRTGKKNDNVTFWQLYERAAKARYGEDIRIVKTDWYKKNVDNIIDKFELCIIDQEKEPREVQRTIVDINMKEYENHGTHAQLQDESHVKMEKQTSTTKGERYSFSTTKGVNYGLGGNIGLKLVGLVSLGADAKVEKSKSKTEETEKTSQEVYSFSYHQEEKIVVPAGKCVKAKITTYRMKYDSDYTLKFSINRDATIPLCYRTTCQYFLFNMCRSYGKVSVRDMISTLPGFNGEDEDDTASYTQPGTLTWVGEGCSVDKKEMPLSGSEL